MTSSDGPSVQSVETWKTKVMKCPKCNKAELSLGKTLNGVSQMRCPNCGESKLCLGCGGFDGDHSFFCPEVMRPTVEDSNEED